MSLLERETPFIRAIYQREYINHNHIDFQNLLDLFTDVNRWRSRYKYNKFQLLSYGQDLMFYGILDTITEATNDVLEKHISAINDTIIPPLVPPVNDTDALLTKVDFSKFDDSYFILSSYDIENQILDDRLKTILKVWQLLEVNKGVEGCLDQPESYYTNYFIYPIINALFDNEKCIFKEHRGTVINEIKADILLSLMFHEIRIAKFSVIEVSGPCHQRDEDLFLLNRNEIAKNLKVLLNGIYRRNTLGRNHITNVKVYGLQIYDNHFYVYSLQLLCPRLYLFKQEMKFTCPLETSQIRSELSSFMENLFTYRSLILSSMNSLLSFLKIQETGGIGSDISESARIQ
ncbi:hypothetical protein K501DRAFT_268984 [Backusella circina FSU 941]|nr:hypothetical protein K501DRAFT_268984 [Backusella circina FSU 941]